MCPRNEAALTLGFAAPGGRACSFSLAVRLRCDLCVHSPPGPQPGLAPFCTSPSFLPFGAELTSRPLLWELFLLSWSPLSLLVVLSLKLYYHKGVDRNTLGHLCRYKL